MAPANPLSVFRLLWSHINLHNRSFQATFWTIGRQGRALLLQVLGCAEMEAGKSPRFVGRLVTLCSLRPLKNHCPHCARNKNNYQPCHTRRPHSHHGTAQWRCIFQPWSSRDCYWWLPPSQKSMHVAFAVVSARGTGKSTMQASWKGAAQATGAQRSYIGKVFCAGLSWALKSKPARAASWKASTLLPCCRGA